MSIYTRKFRVEDFCWKDSTREIVDKICEAGKKDLLQAIVDQKFSEEGDTPSDYEIDEFVAANADDIMSATGVAENKTPRVYTVRLKVSGSVFVSSVGADAVEAGTKACDNLDFAALRRCQMDDIRWEQAWDEHERAVNPVEEK